MRTSDSGVVFGEPNWELIGRLQELCGVHAAMFSIAYSSEDNMWNVTIVGIPGLSPVEFASSDFDSAVLLAVSSAEAAL